MVNVKLVVDTKLKDFRDVQAKNGFDIDYVEFIDSKNTSYVLEDENIDVFFEKDNLIVDGSADWNVDISNLKLDSIQLYLFGTGHEIVLCSGKAERIRKNGFDLVPLTDSVFCVKEYYVISGVNKIENILEG